MTAPQRSSSENDAYNRGLDAGRIEQRLKGHDDHFRLINGSIDEMTQALQVLTDELRANVSRFSASATSDRRDAGEREKIAVTVAAALMEKESSVREEKTQRWTAWQRLFAVLGAIVLVANFTLAIYLALTR
ncbi:hypothetical protein [Micromonospora sp. NBC_01796]|uniref:hypothetical protein n=1 Tax=Micromonospora sp. NBC_01796 TaxID=2975987 RepID=UPI002DD81F06|nr:hypothetical protein [Micromonospora sp. NBC_01796]WSA83020.1 hypothetical protein OIE47_21575 [Micromonospora sp. NBC_01796]